MLLETIGLQVGIQASSLKEEVGVQTVLSTLLYLETLKADL